MIPPRLLGKADAPYPAGATGDARVVVTLVVGRDGRVKSAIADGASEPFLRTAREAALRLEFEPATRDGELVSARIQMELVFRAPVAVAPELRPEAPPALPELPAGEAPPPAESQVVVRGRRSEPSRSATLSRAEVRQLPGAFGDPFRAIEALPGVTPIVSGLPFFFVRGAPPGNVGYFIDGIRVPLLFHVGVGPSVIHPGLVERVDLYPGGYPARFGRFAGGIVAGETAPPVPEWRGEYNLRIFDAGALVEAPFAGGRGTALVGGRYSFAGLALSLLSPENVLEYWDYQARGTYDLTRDDRVGVFAFGSYDYAGEKTRSGTVTLFGTEFHRVDVRYDRSLSSDSSLRTAFMVGSDKSAVQSDRFVRSQVAQARTELQVRLSEDALVRAGTDLELDRYEVDLGTNDLSPSAERVARFFASRTDVAAGARADVVVQAAPGFEVTPGLRVDFFGSQGQGAVGVDPRLSTRVAISGRTALLSALGVAHQPPSFAVPVPGFQPGGLEGGLQKAVQQSLGVEHALGDATTFTATVFQNAFFDMSDPLGAVPPQLQGCPPGAYPADSLGGDLGQQPTGIVPCLPRFIPGTLGPDRSGGGGQAADGRAGRTIAQVFEVRTMGWSRGLELHLKRRLTSRLGGFVAYTLSRSVRAHGSRRYIAAFDRTHVANAAVAYDLGRKWRAGARGTFYTGLPKAPDPTDDSTRLPPFFRLDLRLEKRWTLGERAWLSFVAEWMNATLSKEAVSTECTLEGCKARTIGPVTIPSIGLEGGF